jgi:Major Facilitator Superfamily
MRAVLRRPDFRLFFIGSVATIVGDSVLLLVLAIWVKTLTHSNSLAGLTLFALAAPALGAPVLGWVVDRFRRKPFLVATLVATVLVLVPLLFVRDRGQVWVIYAVAFAYGVSSLLTSAATTGLIKELLPENLLAEANGAFQTVRQGLRLIAPIGGAGLFAVLGGAAVASLDIACLLVGAFTIGSLKLHEPGPANAELHWLGEVTAGLRYLFGPASLRRAIIGLIIAISVLGFAETVVFAYVDSGLHRSPTFVSVLVCVQGVGGLLGGLGAARIVKTTGELASTAFGIALIGVGLAFLVYPQLVLGLVGAVLLGLGIPIGLVGANTLIQRVTPMAVISRVGAAADAVIGTPQALSIAGGAALVTVLDYRLVIVIMAAGMFFSAAYMWSGRALTSASPGEPEPAVAPQPAAGQRGVAALSESVEAVD